MEATVDYLTDPREIRKRLNEAARRGGRIDGDERGDWAVNAPSAMVRQVLMAAEAQGFSGEDAMTLLAYHALLRYEDVLGRLIDQLNIIPAPPMILTHHSNGEIVTPGREKG